MQTAKKLEKEIVIVKEAPKKMKNRKKRQNKRNNNNNNNNSNSLRVRGGESVEGAPVAYGFSSRPRKLLGNQVFRFENSEMIGTINGSVSFSIFQTLSINPGLSACFPWLSRTAVSWQQYKFSRLCFRFVTTSATAATGSLILSPDYNSKEAPPSNLASSVNTQDAVMGSTWRSLNCELKTSSMFSLGNRKNVRNAQISGELNIYDAGRLYVCTEGQADTSAIGNLWVDYVVELAIPQSSPLMELYPSATSIYDLHTAAQTITTATATPVHFETVYDAINFGTASLGVFTPPAGVYWLNGFVSVADSASETFYGYVYVTLNGASNAIQAANKVAAVAGAGMILPINDIVSCNGTDTVRVIVQIYGASGTLTCVDNGSSLTVRLA